MPEYTKHGQLAHAEKGTRPLSPQDSDGVAVKILKIEGALDVTIEPEPSTI
jgi:hypothetical protein